MMKRDEAVQALKKEKRTALHENKVAFDMAIKVLEQTSWTPISKKMPDEKLPKNFRRVLITVVNYAGDKVVRVAIYINLRRQFRVEGSSNIWEIGEKGLLAWRPLTEPYKPESEVE